jgi:uncharacterized protein YrrD
MKVPEPENEQPLSWKALLADTPVFSSEGQEVGSVFEVLGSEQEDIFHGIVVHAGPIGHHVMIPAGTIGTMTNRRVEVAMTTDEIRALAPYQEEESYHLGFVGLFRRRLGWVQDSRDPE